MAILNEANRTAVGAHGLWHTAFGACSLCLDKILCAKNVPARAEKNQPFGAIGQIGPWNSGNRAR